MDQVNLTQKVPTGSTDLKEQMQRLHVVCEETFVRSFAYDTLPKMANGYLFVNDLAAWTDMVAPSPEFNLFQRAEQEYLNALINVAQGQYSNAFKGLRLVLELILQGAYLSANSVELSEWLSNSKDTTWSVLIDPEKGPMSKRFCKAFFPELQSMSDSFVNLARTLYRELSETTHGNVPCHIPIPSSFEFNQEAFDLWHCKAQTIRLVSLFCLSVRYLKEMADHDRSKIELGIMDQLSYIEPIRILFGGPSTA